MKRTLYEVTAQIVDANGSFATLSGYPKTFDSKNYGNDTDKTYKRAEGEFHDALGAMYKRDDRQIQFAMIIDVSTGIQIALGKVGELAELPDPEPEVTEG